MKRKKQVYKRINERDLYYLPFREIGGLRILPYEHLSMGLPVSLPATRQKFYLKLDTAITYIFSPYSSAGLGSLWMTGTRSMQLGDTSGGVWIAREIKQHMSKLLARKGTNETEHSR